MFTPLTFQKNAAIQVDRMNNSGYTASTSAKQLGYGVATNPYLLSNSGSDCTIVVQAWPNSDYDAAPAGGDDHNWIFWTGTNSNFGSTWWMLTCPTDNNTEPGPASNYPTLLGSDGIKKGQLAINCRCRPGTPSNTTDRDWIALINSGSIYDWSDPQPITIALGFNHGANEFVCAVNGESGSVVFENRNNKSSPPINTARFFTDIVKADSTDPDINTRDLNIACGYSSLFSTRNALSGSFGEVSFYDTLLTMDEMKLVTNQPYGQPTNILDTQPTMLYRMREELKEASSGGSVPNSINKAFPQLGTQGGSDISQIQSVISDTALSSLDSGSVMNTQAYEYQPRP